MKTVEMGGAMFSHEHKTIVFDGLDAQGNQKIIHMGEFLSHVPESISVAGRKKRSRAASRATISRAPLSAQRVNVEYTDKANNTIYGTIELSVGKVNFSTDGKVINTEAPESAEKDDERNLAVLALAAWYESSNPDMCLYRKKVEDGTATDIDCWRYSESFYYDYVIDNPNIQVEYNAIVSIPTEKKKPIQTRSVRKISSDSILPWKSKKLADVPNDCSIASCLQGKYLLPYQWGIVEEDGEQYDFGQDIIPISFLEGYVDNLAFRTVLREIVGSIGALFRANDLDDSNTKASFSEVVKSASKSINSTLRNKLLVGEPGTGKTMLVQAVAAALGLPCVVIRLSALSEIDVITEEVRVTDTGFKSIKSKCYWLTKYGGLVCFDDMTNADPNTFFAALGGALEAPFQLQVGQKLIQRHPLSFMFATANVGTEGSRSINEALLTRFPNIAYVQKLDDKTFKECITSRALRDTGANISDGEMFIIVNWVFTVYTQILTMIKQHNVDIAEKLITLRAPIALTETLLNDYVEGFKLDPIGSAIETFANILYAAGEPDLREVAAKAIESSSIKEFKNLR